MADSAPAVAAYTVQFPLTTTVNPPGAGNLISSSDTPGPPGRAYSSLASGKRPNMTRSCLLRAPGPSW